MNNLIEQLVIENPKQNSRNRIGRNSLYSYYAGFSPSFVNSLLTSPGISKEAKIVDPWNGSGTTTNAAIRLGHNTQGYDLNPVMVIAAKACMLNVRAKNSLWPIAADIMSKASKNNPLSVNDEDPLCTWMVPNSVLVVRNIEKALQNLLVDNGNYQPLILRNNFNDLSDIAAFFYAALFRCTRSLVSDFIASNPTWIKKPKLLSSRLQPSKKMIIDKFGTEVLKMIRLIDQDVCDSQSILEEARIEVASSEFLPISDKSVDFILSSPPYCTRIDYAVATMPELALLGYKLDSDFKHLRRKLIGTSTVPSAFSEPLSAWGKTCNKFLRQLSDHESKASKTYYYKNHIQYFDSIYKSFLELKRVLRSDGVCILVVQDSYYKDLHNDLPKIFAEMASNSGLEVKRKADFILKKTMADINSRSNKYNKLCGLTESVICFFNN
jgi:DNA modification methylase